jgi:glycosyltransferase involved in cell wall biosynthesis
MPRVWARAAFGLPPDRKVIAFGATSITRWNKGLQILKLALENLRAQWKGVLPLLLIFGHGDARESFPQEYECLPLGQLNQTELAQVYSAADVYVLPSLQDNLPTTLIEAQSCGTPGIGFYGTGAEDIIQDGITGYLAAHPGLPLTPDGKLRDMNEFLNPEKIDDLAAKIRMILELPAERIVAMRERCREHALREYSPVLQTGRYLRLYRRILSLPEMAVGGLPE